MSKLARQLLAASFLIIGFQTLAAAATNEELIAATWHCEPTLIEQGIFSSIATARRYLNAHDEPKLVFYMGINTPLSPTSLEALNLKCKPEDAATLQKYSSDELLNAFINKYVVFEWTESGLFKDKTYVGNANEFQARLKSSSSITYKFSFSSEYYSEKKAFEENEEERLAKEREQQRIDYEKQVQEEQRKRQAEFTAADQARAAEAAKRLALLKKTRTKYKMELECGNDSLYLLHIYANNTADIFGLKDNRGNLSLDESTERTYLDMKPKVTEYYFTYTGLGNNEHHTYNISRATLELTVDTEYRSLPGKMQRLVYQCREVSDVQLADEGSIFIDPRKQYLELVKEQKDRQLKMLRDRKL